MVPIILVIVILLNDEVYGNRTLGVFFEKKWRNFEGALSVICMAI